MSDAKAEFIAAWKAHDGHPGDPIRTNRRVDALAAVAEEIGMSPVHLQDILAAWKRNRFTHEQSLEAVIAGLQIGKVS